MLSHYVWSYFRLFFATWTCLKREEARKPIKFDGSHWLFPMVGCFFGTRKPHLGPFFLKHRQIEAGFSTISENPISMFEKFQWFFNGRSSELVWYLFSIFQNKKGELVGDRNSNIIGCQISESNIWWSHVYIYIESFPIPLFHSSTPSRPNPLRLHHGYGRMWTYGKHWRRCEVPIYLGGILGMVDWLPSGKLT